MNISERCLEFEIAYCTQAKGRDTVFLESTFWLPESFLHICNVRTLWYTVAELNLYHLSFVVVRIDIQRM